MKTFYSQSTQYYIRSSQVFHTASLRVPSLLFVSKTDPVGTVTSNLTLRDTWESKGMKVSFLTICQKDHVKIPVTYHADIREDIRGVAACRSLLYLSQRIRCRIIRLPTEAKLNSERGED